MEVEPRYRIAITPETPLDDEARQIAELLDSGRFTGVHLRHPAMTRNELLRLIERIPQRLHCGLRLHGHFDLLNEFNLGGIHLNSRCRTKPTSYSGAVSASCHTLDEVARCEGMEYVTLSPIFDSISKPGYKAAFAAEELMRLSDIKHPPVVALGGITPDNLSLLTPYGFSGYAMLSAAWQ